MNREEILRSYGLKVTKPRETILKIIMESTEAIDAESIKNAVAGEDLVINLSTVYRTLDLYHELGLVEKFDMGDNKYHYSMKEYHHDHALTCDLCHKIVHMECPMTNIEKQIAKETGFSITRHHLELGGLCKDCASKEEKESKS